MVRPRVKGRAIAIATIVAMVTFGVGYAVAAATVTTTTETANGNYVNTAGPAGWSLLSPAVAFVPSSGLSAASTVVGTPTVFTTSASYSVGTVTAGDVGQVFKFSETASAPASTELEITFTVSAASVTVTTVYVETQATPTANTMAFYVDVGSAASTSVTINYAGQVSQQCSAVGTCP